MEKVFLAITSAQRKIIVTEEHRLLYQYNQIQDFSITPPQMTLTTKSQNNLVVLVKIAKNKAVVVR